MAVIAKGLYNHGRDGIYHSIDSDNKNPLKMIGSRFNFIYSGYSYRATEMEAAIGLGHLKRFKEEKNRRNWNFKYLTKRINNELSDHLWTVTVMSNVDPVWMVYPIICKDKSKREKLIQHLEKHGIDDGRAIPE